MLGKIVNSYDEVEARRSSISLYGVELTRDYLKRVRKAVYDQLDYRVDSEFAISFDPLKDYLTIHCRSEDTDYSIDVHVENGRIVGIDEV